SFGDATAGALPLGFSGEALSFRGAESSGVIPAYVDCRMLLLPLANLSLEPVVRRFAARSLHENGIALVGNLRLVHIERIETNLADGRVIFERVRIPGKAGVRPVICAPARELTARNKYHPRLGGEADLAQQQENKPGFLRRDCLRAAAGSAS